MSEIVKDDNPYSRLMALKKMGIVENYAVNCILWRTSSSKACWSSEWEVSGRLLPKCSPAAVLESLSSTTMTRYNWLIWTGSSSLPLKSAIPKFRRPNRPSRPSTLKYQSKPTTSISQPKKATNMSQTESLREESMGQSTLSSVVWITTVQEWLWMLFATETIEFGSNLGSPKVHFQDIFRSLSLERPGALLVLVLWLLPRGQKGPSREREFVLPVCLQLWGLLQVFSVRLCWSTFLISVHFRIAFPTMLKQISLTLTK